MDNQAQAPAGEPAPLLATKLYLPRPRAQLVARPRLLARLDAALQGSVTLLAAPAGFGKTTILADWLSRGAATGRHVAWLALDAGDSDPIQFLRYLIAALQTIAPSVGAAALPLLRSAHAPPLGTLLLLLVNDLMEMPDASLLVLDDYHAVDAPAVHEALAFLLDHLPPQLHLVLASRVDPPFPLSRWRARGQLTELRASDLRFTTDEAASFLREAMGVPLTAADVAALEARTEGWIAGLQLAALSLQDRSSAQISSFIDSFTGSHRFVVDYLADEVLARQPGHVERFLLETSILERLCGSLCDAVVEVVADAPGSEGSRPVSNVQVPAPMQSAYSQRMLEHLEHANLFIVPLDDERRWYRYHHLFAQVLRERLAGGATRETVAALHRRASIWFEGHGLAVEAAQHALAGHDWERAARLIEQHGRLLMVNGQAPTVRGWLKSLPDAVVRAHPYVLLIQALGLFFANELEAAELHLHAAEAQLAGDTQDNRSRSILGYATILRASIARASGDLTRCVTLAGQGLALLPPADASGRMAANVHVAETYLLSGDVSPASERPLAAAVAAARDAGELTNLLYAGVALAALQRRQGRLRQAAVTYREAAQVLPEQSGLQALPNGADYYFGLGDLLREWNDGAAAEGLLTQGREMVRAMRLAAAESIVAGYAALARVQQARGDEHGALATLAELQQVADLRRFAPHLLPRLAAAQARLALLQGDLAAAVRWADASGLSCNGALSYPREQEYLVLVRVRIVQGRSDPTNPTLRDVLRLLDRLLAAAEAGARLDSVIEILVVRSLAWQTHGDRAAALGDLERALPLAAREGYVRLFVDEGAPMAALLTVGLGVGGWGVGNGSIDLGVRAYAEQLLQLSSPVMSLNGAASSSAVPIPNPQYTSANLLPDPLTERELEILRLLAAGRSNQAIAGELIVAVGTVKRHVSNIMDKLQAASRLEAVARGRDLGLV